MNQRILHSERDRHTKPNCYWGIWIPDRRNGTVANAIKEILFLGNSSVANLTRDDCVWRKENDPQACPDPDMKFILYTSDRPKEKQIADLSQGDWLRNSGWNPQHENIILIHGYAGGDDTLPIMVLRDGKFK